MFEAGVEARLDFEHENVFCRRVLARTASDSNVLLARVGF
jgi:hypothetical protein